MRIRLDTLMGMGMSNLVALAIMATAAATLHQSHTQDLQSAAQAAIPRRLERDTYELWRCPGR